MKGLLVGFTIAAPVGPIGVLCIRRTLADGWLTGLVTGLGAASADAFYASLAGFGLTVLAQAFISQAVWIRLVGGIFLCYLGIRTLRAIPGDQDSVRESNGLPSAYGSTFALTITNPMTILSFGAIFAGLGYGSQAVDFRSAGTMIGGVFLGSAAWWLTLSAVVSRFRRRLDRRAMRWVNRISGLVMLGFGTMITGPVLVDIF